MKRQIIEQAGGNQTGPCGEFWVSHPENSI